MLNEIKQIQALNTEANNWFLKQKITTTIENFIQEFNKKNQNLSSIIKKLLKNKQINDLRNEKLIAKSNEIKNMIDSLQNPQDCNENKHLYCMLAEHLCGFGCQLHFLMICFIQGIYRNRTVIFKDPVPGPSDPVNFMNNKEFNRFYSSYEPFGKCDHLNQEHLIPITLNKDLNEQINVKSIKMHIRHNFYPTQPENVPFSYHPSRFLNDLNYLNEYVNDPLSWIMGQFMKHILKMNKKTNLLVENEIALKQIPKPYLGLQIRKGNKVGTEGKAYSLDDYMKYAKKYFDENYEITERIIYLSTDDTQIIREAKRKYPNYKFYHQNDDYINVAVKYEKILSLSLFQGLLIDLNILAEAEYVICTHSSNVCRLVYEFMQAQDDRVEDAHFRIKSLDNEYFATNFNVMTKVAVKDHEALNSKEIDLKVGHIIYIFSEQHYNNKNVGNLWNGYTKGRNMQTNQVGLFPSFKVTNYFVCENINYIKVNFKSS